MPALNDILLTIGGAEVSEGTAVAREYVLPLRGLPSLKKTVERAIDPAIIGLGMDAGEYAVADNVAGSIPLSLRACGAIGQILHSLLGTDAVPTTTGGLLRVRYTGSDESCRLQIISGTLTAITGTLGTEVLDSDFDSDGSLQLNVYSSVGSLATAIEAFTNYEGESVFEVDGDVTATNAVACSFQAKNVWAYIHMTGSGSAYRHTFVPEFTVGEERPNYSIQLDGFQDRYLYPGCVAEGLSMSAALKGMVEGDVEILGMGETADPTASALVLEDIGPMIFHDGAFTIGSTDYPYIRNMSLSIKNTHNPEGYGQGSISRQYHQRGKLEVTGTVQLRLDANSIAERAKIVTGALVGISFWFQSPEDIDTNVPYQMIVEMPYCTISTFEFTDNGGQIDATINFKALRPKGTRYSEPLTIHLITDDSAAY